MSTTFDYAPVSYSQNFLITKIYSRSLIFNSGGLQTSNHVAAPCFELTGNSSNRESFTRESLGVFPWPDWLVYVTCMSRDNLHCSNSAILILILKMRLLLTRLNFICFGINGPLMRFNWLFQVLKLKWASAMCWWGLWFPTEHWAVQTRQRYED